jgi:predicted GIY-YIG superfamily endonuclease
MALFCCFSQPLWLTPIRHRFSYNGITQALASKMPTHLHDASQAWFGQEKLRMLSFSFLTMQEALNLEIVVGSSMYVPFF